jgi:site-specific DNA recombinase
LRSYATLLPVSELLSFDSRARIYVVSEAGLRLSEAANRRGSVRSSMQSKSNGAIRIINSKDILQAAIAGRQTENGNVRGFVRKWRARHDSNV